jgi:hypothetical protein
MCRQAQKNPAQKRGFLLAVGTVGLRPLANRRFAGFDTNLTGTNLNAERSEGGPEGAEGRKPGVNKPGAIFHELALRASPKGEAQGWAE